MLGIAIFVVALVFFAKLGLQGMLYGYAFGYLLSSIYALWSTKIWNYLDLKNVSWSEIKTLIKYSAPLIPNAISWWIVNASDRTIINFFLGAAANGVYAIANKVPSLCTTLFNVFNISWQENVSSAINDNDREEYFEKIFANIIKVLVSICICIISVDFILFHYIFDIKYLEGMKYVPILITACIFTVVSQFFGGIFIGLKEPKYNGGTTVISAIINVVVHLALVKFVGLYAAAISTLVAFAFLCIVRYCIIKKRFAIKIKKDTTVFIAIYIYFIIMHHIDYMPINIINIIVASWIFLYVNKEYAIKFIRKVRQ
ncbi:MAG TPA: oligosaccharide flippase family protein [Candidatus Faecimorpha stercoravium]|nr:oligosaccharide flippase family protein [Candidatus Faecimorpha stercoravium]